MTPIRMPLIRKPFNRTALIRMTLTCSRPFSLKWSQQAKSIKDFEKKRKNPFFNIYTKSRAAKNRTVKSAV